MYRLVARVVAACRELGFINEHADTTVGLALRKTREKQDASHCTKLHNSPIHSIAFRIH